MDTLLERLSTLVLRFEEIGKLITDPDVIADMKRYVKLNKEYRELEKIAQARDTYQRMLSNLDEAKDILNTENDPEMRELAKAEISELEPKIPEMEETIKLLLIPADPEDGKNVVMEIRGGTGGDEAAIFAGDLFKMYSHYIESKGWKMQVTSFSEGTLGGYKEIVFEVSGDNVYGTLKYESGVHRVQRVPATETQGRVHTSAATVAVLPEAEEVDVEINPADLEIQTARSSGAGGQNVNKVVASGTLGFRMLADGSAILIGSYAEFQMINPPPPSSFGKYTTTGIYKLEADLNLMNEEWEPIGNNNVPFEGIFDGNGKKLYNLKISSGVEVGLFGVMDLNGIVKNLGIASGSVKGTESVGGVVGRMKSGSKIIAVYNNATVEGTTMNIGGIAGICIPGITAPTLITACYNTGVISGGATGQFVGGVAGSGSSIAIACYNTGAVSGERRAGSVLGAAGGSTDCYYLQGTASVAFQQVTTATGTTSFSGSFTPTGTEWGTGDGSGSGKYWKPNTVNGRNGVTGLTTLPQLWWE